MRTGGAKKRRDETEPAIIDALRACGAFVRQVHGDGAPDLIVKLKGRWLPLEVKSPTGRVRPSQGGYPIVRTPAEALALWDIKLLGR